MMLENLIYSLVNGSIYGLLLFLLASGLTLIFSMMGVLNFAHAGFYMLGAYVGFTVAGYTNFWVALLIAPIVVGVFGALIERYALRHVHQYGPVPELIFTFGLFFLIEEFVKFSWGNDFKDFAKPETLQGDFITILGSNYTNYRVFMLVVSILIFISLFMVLKRTRIGLIIQAAIDKPHVVGMLGHNVPLIFMVTFGVGTALAAIAGVIAGPELSTSPAMGLELGSIVFAIIIIGGLGSLPGAFLSSLIIGIILTFTKIYDVGLVDIVSIEDLREVFGLIGVSIPEQSTLYELWTVKLPRISDLLPFLLLVLVLIFKPAGLMGKREG